MIIHYGGSIVDFACGSGSIGAALTEWEPSIAMTMLDANALALLAAKQNVPHAAAHVRRPCLLYIYIYIYDVSPVDPPFLLSPFLLHGVVLHPRCVRPSRTGKMRGLLFEFIVQVADLSAHNGCYEEPLT